MIAHSCLLRHCVDRGTMTHLSSFFSSYLSFHLNCSCYFPINRYLSKQFAVPRMYSKVACLKISRQCSFYQRNFLPIILIEYADLMLNRGSIESFYVPKYSLYSLITVQLGFNQLWELIYSLVSFADLDVRFRSSLSYVPTSWSS